MTRSEHAPPRADRDVAGRGAATRRYGRSAGTLTIGVGAMGALIYVYFALASRGLDGAEYGRLVLVWVGVSIAASILYRPIEQLLSRTVSEREARGEPTAGGIRVAAAIQLGLAAGVAIAMLAARGPLEDGLLSGDEDLYRVLVLATFAYAGGFFVRGLLAGRRRFGLYGTVLIGESVARVAFAFPLALGIAEVSLVALGILAAPLIGLAFLPPALAGSRGPAPDPEATSPRSGSDGDLTLGGGGRFAAALMAVMLCEQAFINGAPLILGAISGAAAAGYIFNVLMLARAPALLFQAVSTSLLPHLTRLHVSDEEGSAGVFDDSVRATLAGVAAFTAVSLAVVLAVGPQLMQLAFGDAHTYDRAGLALVTLGMGFLLAATTLTQVAVAQGQVRRAATRWVMATAGFLVWAALPILEQFRRVEIGFACATAVLLVLIHAIERRPRPIAEDVPAPGSARELEAQLAAAEEAS